MDVVVSDDLEVRCPFRVEQIGHEAVGGNPVQAGTPWARIDQMDLVHPLVDERAAHGGHHHPAPIRMEVVGRHAILRMAVRRLCQRAPDPSERGDDEAPGAPAF